jgi:hypothetical protein
MHLGIFDACRIFKTHILDFFSGASIFVCHFIFLRFDFCAKKEKLRVNPLASSLTNETCRHPKSYKAEPILAQEDHRSACAILAGVHKNHPDPRHKDRPFPKDVRYWFSWFSWFS